MTFFYIFIIIFLIFFFGIAYLIYRVVKKSTEKKSPEFLAQEKQEMIQKLVKPQKNLATWEPNSIERLSNKIDYNYKKGISRTFNGTIKAANHEPLIAFRMVDRGMRKNCRIAACSSNKVYFLEADETGMRFAVNGKPLGDLNNNGQLITAENQTIGKAHFLEDGTINVTFDDKRSARIKQNTERRRILFNPFFEVHHSPGSLESFMTWENEVTFDNQMVVLQKGLDKEQQHWVMSLALFNIIYFGIDFTQ